ncbi:hypothetical protein [Caudoviricetes sp.]|nr:hypothetical protein [Caudoviricetes sp.]
MLRQDKGRRSEHPCIERLTGQKLRRVSVKAHPLLGGLSLSTSGYQMNLSKELIRVNKVSIRARGAPKFFACESNPMLD